MNIRQETLLRDLVSHEDYVTGQSLSQQLGVSTKTIYADLNQLNQLVMGFGAKIERVPRHGVRLLATPEQRTNLQKLLRGERVIEDDSPLQREFRLLKTLFQVGFIDVIEWSIEYYISEASIRRDLDRLEKQMTNYHLQLQKRSGQVFLVGKEKDIRIFFRNYILERFEIHTAQQSLQGYLNNLFSAETIHEMESIIEECSKDYHFTISEQYRIYLLLDLLISTQRYLAGHEIITERALVFDDPIQHYEVYLFAGALLSQSTGIAMDCLADLEIKQMSYALLSVGYENQRMESPRISETVKRFIDKVSELSKIDFTTDAHLLQMLVNHVQPMIYRLKNGINVKNQTTEEIKKKYSVLYHIVWLASKILGEEYQLELLDAEIAFLTIYFEISVEKRNKPLTIYVICPHGLATSELIMNAMTRIVSDFDHLIKIDLKDLTRDKVVQADMIISSIFLDDASPKYLFISPIATDAELEMVQKRYASLTKGNRHMLAIIDDAQVFQNSMIHELLQDKILLQQQVSSVDDCIRFLVEQSDEENQMENDFLESVLARERMGSTSVYTGIALPHANPKSVKKSQLLMMTLQKPIQWGKNLVKVVMLIAIADGEEKLYKDTLIQLYSKIDNPDYIDRLWLSQTQEDFLKELTDDKGGKTNDG